MPDRVSPVRASPSCSRGHSFRGINDPEDSSLQGIRCPEDAPPSESITTWDQLFPSRARRLQQPASLISTYIHGIRYTARSSRVSNVATTPTLVQIVTECSRNHSRNQEHNPNRYKRITTCRSCDYWNLHDSHCQWSLSGYIYTRRSTKRELPHIYHQHFSYHLHFPHKDQPPEKRRDKTLKIQRILFLKQLSHCNLRLQQSSNSAEFIVTSWK